MEFQSIAKNFLCINQSRKHGKVSLFNVQRLIKRIWIPGPFNLCIFLDLTRIFTYICGLTTH